MAAPDTLPETAEATGRANAKEMANAIRAGETDISPASAHQLRPSGHKRWNASDVMDEATYAHSAQQQTPTSKVRGKEQEERVGTVARVGVAKPAAKDGEVKAKGQEARVMDGAKAKAKDPGKEFTDWN